MQREIYEISAKIIDANGNYNTLDGYPKKIDSHSYNDDLEKARQRAYGEWHDVLGVMCKRDDRQLQMAYILRVSDGIVIECAVMGAIAEV